ARRLPLSMNLPPRPPRRSRPRPRFVLLASRTRTIEFMVPMREQKGKEASPELCSRERQAAHSRVVGGNLSKRLSFIACLLFSFSAQTAELVPVEELGL